ncbi:MAG: Fic family protein [Selenomonadaceae bacterium]|nr:Fic family protein [Selenomonadaceae bacterium]
MDYERLDKIYYADEDAWREQYKNRFNAPFTRHLPLTIREFNRQNEYELFYCCNEEIISLYDGIMSECLKLRSLLENIPPVGIEQFINSCIVDEIKASNDVEGVRSSRKEIRSALYASAEDRLSLRFSGIVNKYMTIINGQNVDLNSCQDIRALFDDLIADEIESSDPSDLPDGKIFRKGSVDVVSGTQKTIHRGVYPEEKIIDHMTVALSILHDKKIPSLIGVGIFHYLFGYIHPFYDGNGRMARFITSYRLSEILTMPVVALRVSLLIKTQRKQYYELFAVTNSELNCGDLTPFIIGTLQFIKNAVENTERILHAKLDNYNRFRNKIDGLNLNDRTAEGVYDILLQATVFSNWGATLKDICNTLGKSENTVAARLKKIPDTLLIRQKEIRPYLYKINLTEWDQL